VDVPARSGIRDRISSLSDKVVALQEAASRRSHQIVWDCLSPKNFRPTVTGNSTTMSYVMKADTRINGPWTDQDPEELYVPKQVREITLWSWQKSVVQSLSEWDDRHINVLINPGGNIGKSVLKTYCGVHGLARAIPPFESHKDLMNMVYDMKPKLSGAAYIIDIPRAIDQKGMRGLWGAIESLKDGYCYDLRYKFRECYFDSPVIWVFMNEMPETKWLSRDRWRFNGIIANEEGIHLDKSDWQKKRKRVRLAGGADADGE